MDRKVIFLPEVVDYLEEIALILYKQGYFGFKDACKKYIDKLSDYTFTYVGVLQGKSAPDHFAQYGSNLKYITYTPNQRTSWYILSATSGQIYCLPYYKQSYCWTIF
jgi:hypothetical protein